MEQSFAALVLGGTGEVGSAAVAALLAIPECREVVMITRRPVAAAPRIRNIVLDSAAAGFPDRVAEIARDSLSRGRTGAVSCAGVGCGSLRWSEEELKRLEIGVVGGFAHGCRDAGVQQFCLLSAVGSTAKSRFRYVRVMGMKEDNLRGIGFPRLAIFRPGIITGNVHTPAWSAWLGRFLPSRYGNVDQRVIGRAIAAELALHDGNTGEVIYENAAMEDLTARVIPLST